MHHLGTRVAQVLNRKGNGAFYAVKIIVNAQSLHHEKRCRNSAQAQFGGEILLKKVLYQLYCLFCSHLI